LLPESEYFDYLELAVLVSDARVTFLGVFSFKTEEDYAIESNLLGVKYYC